MFLFSVNVRRTWRAEQTHESAGESESTLFFIAWGAEGRYLFCVCGSRLGNLCFVVCIIISLIIWFLCVCIQGVCSGMHDTELLEGEEMLLGGSIE